MELCLSDKQILEAYPVMKQLRTHLSEQAYLKKVRECQKEGDYQLYAHRSDNRETVACCGVMNRQTLMTVVYGFVIWL